MPASPLLYAGAAGAALSDVRSPEASGVNLHRPVIDWFAAADTQHMGTEGPWLPFYEELKSRVNGTDWRARERWVVSCYGYEPSSIARREAWYRSVSERARRDDLILVVEDIDDIHWQEAALLIAREAQERDEAIAEWEKDKQAALAAEKKRSRMRSAWRLLACLACDIRGANPT